MEFLRIRAAEGDPPVLQVDGEIDMSTADELRTALEKALAADPTVVVDMAGVTFCDAAGLQVVLQTAASLNGAGPLTLLNAAPVKRLLDILRLTDVACIAIREEPAHCER
jgi:anti-sigma B factor antagonist